MGSLPEIKIDWLIDWFEYTVCRSARACSVFTQWRIHIGLMIDVKFCTWLKMFWSLQVQCCVWRQHSLFYWQRHHSPTLPVCYTLDLLITCIIIIIIIVKLSVSSGNRTVWRHSQKNIATPPQKDRTTATCNIHRKFSELWPYGFYARQHICYSAYMLWQFRLSVRLPVRLTHTGGSVKNG